tara:strand:+ start:384 stop:974 length:591 start_codon:yes stop_codon:yes gene_type:complete
MKLTKFICPVPNKLTGLVTSEIDTIDWDKLDDGRTKRTVAFASSKSVQIRIHKQPTVMLDNVHDWGEIVETVDHPIHSRMYRNILEVSQWVLGAVNGNKLGRVFVANLAGRGIIHPHIDIGEYFEVHSRFHIPIVTNKNAIFLNSLDTEVGEHMSVGNLYKLNNSVLHGFKNLSDLNRIHLIIDIELSHRNSNNYF